MFVVEYWIHMSCAFLFLKSHDDHKLIKVSEDLMTLVSVIRLRELEDGDLRNIN